MENITCNTQRLMAPAGVARERGAGDAFYAGWPTATSPIISMKPCTHPTTESFGNLTTQWPEETPL